jgi:hypothetical protein
MRDFDENNITDAVIEQFRNTPDQRLKQILVSLVKHLLIREFTSETPGRAPDGRLMERPYRKLTYDFRLRQNADMG